MKTTNQAFIEAYRQVDGIVAVPTQATKVTSNPASIGTAPMSASQIWQNVEITTWQLPTEDAEADAGSFIATNGGLARVDAAHLDGPHFETPQAQRMKRRLSEIAAERQRLETGGQPAPVVPTKVERTPHAFHWPELCAELLAMAATQYDAALRTLTDDSGHALLLGVVSTRPQAGCTTTAMCLALRAATLGLRPLLLEATSASMASQLGMANGNGWWTLTQRHESPLRAAHFDARSGVAILPSGDELPDEFAPTALFELASAIGTLRQKHRIVIVDLGSVDAQATAHRTQTLMSAMGVDRLLALTGGAETEIETLQERLGPHADRLAGVLGIAHHG